MYSSILELYNKINPMDSLAGICYAMLPYFLELFFRDRKIPIIPSSSLNLDSNIKGSDLVLEICKKLGANEYYSGIMGRDYLDEMAFERAGIKILYQDYKYPHYYSVVHQLFTIGPIL
jgi:hypothetical protein